MIPFPTAEEVAINWRRTAGFEPARDALVLEDEVGFVAHVNVDAQVRAGKVVHWIEGWVRQDRRREGIGRALLSWAERHSAELVARGVTPGPGLPHVVGFGVLESIPAAMAFAAAATGYARIRYGFEMRRPLDEPIPDAALPAESSSGRSARPTTGGSGMPTSRRSGTTGSHATATRATSRRPSPTRSSTRRCGGSRGLATRSSGRS